MDRRPRAEKPLKDRTLREQRNALKILRGTGGGAVPFYDPAVHPAGLVAFFQKRLDELGDAVHVITEKGQQSYLKKPVRPPTLAAYAASIGVSRFTLRNWSQRHDEFSDAYEIAKTIQEAIVVELALQGAYNSNFAAFVLKNLQGWTDRVEATHVGGIVLKLDEQDSEL